ncbi:hypothetical protein Tco_1220637 [Tanacetum coccineum]
MISIRVNHFSSSLKAINPSLCIMSQSIPEQLNDSSATSVDLREGFPFQSVTVLSNKGSVHLHLVGSGAGIFSSVIISTKIFHIRVTGHWVKSTLVNLGQWARLYQIGSNDKHGLLCRAVLYPANAHRHVTGPMSASYRLCVPTSLLSVNNQPASMLHHIDNFPLAFASEVQISDFAECIVGFQVYQLAF